MPRAGGTPGHRRGAPADRARAACGTGRTVDTLLTVKAAGTPAHLAKLSDFRARGTLLMVGTFGNPQEEGSMGSFTTREAAEEFVAGDPFVLYGVIRDWRIREWNEIFTDS